MDWVEFDSFKKIRDYLNRILGLKKFGLSGVSSNLRDFGILDKNTQKVVILSPSNRRHFRILYPDDLRPELIINGNAHQLMDISVSGLRFECTSQMFEKEKESLVMTVGFKSGDRPTLKGSIVKIAPPHYMIQFHQQLPMSTLKKEADILLQKHGVVPTDV